MCFVRKQRATNVKIVLFTQTRVPPLSVGSKNFKSNVLSVLLYFLHREKARSVPNQRSPGPTPSVIKSCETGQGRARWQKQSNCVTGDGEVTCAACLQTPSPEQRCDGHRMQRGTEAQRDEPSTRTSRAADRTRWGSVVVSSRARRQTLIDMSSVIEGGSSSQAT